MVKIKAEEVNELGENKKQKNCRGNKQIQKLDLRKNKQKTKKQEQKLDQLPDCLIKKKKWRGHKKINKTSVSKIITGTEENKKVTKDIFG